MFARMEHTSTAQRLKELREAAGVGLREMARRVGLSPSGYSHYENPKRFKDPYLTMELALKVAEALEDQVDRSIVLGLAGSMIQPEKRDTNDFIPRLARLSDRRRRMLEDLLEQLEAAEAADQDRRTEACDSVAKDDKRAL